MRRFFGLKPQDKGREGTIDQVELPPSSFPVTNSNLTAEEEVEMKKRVLEGESKNEVKRSRDDESYPIDVEWLLETFKGVVDSEDVSLILSLLRSIQPRLKVGGLIALGLNESEKKLMEHVGVPVLVRVEIERYAKERKTTAAATSSVPVIQSFDEFESLIRSVPMVPETSVDHPKEQALRLGPFNRPECVWPFVRRGQDWRVDLEFLPSLLEEEIRPSARIILDQLAANTQPYHLMLAVSGSGKTSAFADVARTHFVIYMQCTSLREQGVRRSRGYDAGFVAMLDSYESTRDRYDVEKNASHAKRLSMVEITCRLAQLYRLVQIKPDLTPFEFYVHQRQVGDEWVQLLRLKAKYFSSDACLDYVARMRAELEHVLQRFSARLIIAVDEIAVGAEEFLHDFDVDKKKQKGFLSPLVRALVALEPAGRFTGIFTGTASSLHREETVIKSGLNKKEDLFTYKGISSMFPPVTVEACQKVFSRLNLDGVVDLEKLSDEAEFDPEWTDDHKPVEELVNYCIIGGRFRTLTRVIEEIVGLQRNLIGGERDRRRVLRETIMTSITSMRRDLMKMIERHAAGRIDQMVIQRFNSLLARLWTGLRLNGGHMTIATNSEVDDLMMLGIGNFSETNSVGYYTVTERIVGLAVHDYLEQDPDRSNNAKYHDALGAFQRLVAIHGNIPARGNLLEHLVFESLLRSDLQNMKVGELLFIKPFIPPPSVQPCWWETTLFQAKDIKYHHSLLEGESTSSFLASPSSHGVVYSPETVARFDGAVMLDSQHAMVFAMTIWNTMVPREKVQSQIRSTDMSNAYFLADGTKVNKAAKQARSEWENHGLHKIHAARVHIALPKFSSGAVDQEDTSGTDDLLIHLDQSNCHLLFGKDEALYRLLAIATDTEVESWAGATL